MTVELTGCQGSHEVTFKTDSKTSLRAKLCPKQVVVVWYLFDIRKQMDLKAHLTKTHSCKLTFQAVNCKLFKFFQRNAVCWRHFVHLKTVSIIATVWFAFGLTWSCISTRFRKDHPSGKVSAAIEYVWQKFQWRPSRQINMNVVLGLSRATFKLHSGHSIFGGHFEIALLKLDKPSYISSLNVSFVFVSC